MTQSSVKRSRAALYHRPSILKPNAPWRELRAAAMARGYEIATEIQETEGAERDDHPGLERVVAAARAGEIQALLVLSLHDLGSSLREVLTTIQKLVDSQVRVEVVAQGLTIDPRDKGSTDVALGVLSALADFEHSACSEATRDGLQRARRQGRRLGRPPLPKRNP